MAGRAIYKLKGSRLQGQRVNSLRLSSSREVALNENIELSEAEYQRLNKKYVLHKVKDVEPAEPTGSDQPGEYGNENND